MRQANTKPETTVQNAISVERSFLSCDGNPTEHKEKRPLRRSRTKCSGRGKKPEETRLTFCHIHMQINLDRLTPWSLAKAPALPPSAWVVSCDGDYNG